MKKYGEIFGDGGSDIAGQIAAQRRQIRERLSTVRNILAIGSGKGGVGKSTLVTQLAFALAGRGLKAGILDADINGPSQIRLAGLQKSPLIPGENGLIVPRTEQGIRVLSFATMFSEDRAVEFPSLAEGESYTWRVVKEFSALSELLASVEWGELDFLIVDLPPGAERIKYFAEFFGRRAGFILVSIPSALARGVVKRSIAALESAGARVLGYVENMKGYYCSACSQLRPLFPEGGAPGFEIPCLGEVPFDAELARLCDEGKPACARKDSPAALAVEKITDLIVEGVRNEISVC